MKTGGLGSTLHMAMCMLLHRQGSCDFIIFSASTPCRPWCAGRSILKQDARGRSAACRPALAGRGIVMVVLRSRGATPFACGSVVSLAAAPVLVVHNYHPASVLVLRGGGVAPSLAPLSPRLSAHTRTWPRPIMLLGAAPGCRRTRLRLPGPGLGFRLGLGLGVARRRRLGREAKYRVSAALSVFRHGVGQLPGRWGSG